MALSGTWPSRSKASTAPLMNTRSLTNTLPVLPGYNFRDNNAGRSTYKKRHAFTYCNRVPQAVDCVPVSCELTSSQQKITPVSIHQAHPNWLSLDHKVLRFFAFFKESVHESVEDSRIRKCNLYYFLEDDTIQITEGRIQNSGIVQGNFLKRQRVPVAEGSEDHYHADDLNVGKEIEIFGKVFRIVDCDAFTRDFYDKLGCPLLSPEAFPEDQHTARRLASSRTLGRARDEGHEEMRRFQELAAGGRFGIPNTEEREAAQNFYEHDRKVLHFYAAWDDRDTLCGDCRQFNVLYFLADGTVKVSETNPPNSGRDPFPVFIKRQRLPKTRNPHEDCNMETMSTIPQDFISQKDLAIGRTIEIYGRQMMLYDCDTFTQQWYRSNYGIADFTPIDVSVPKKQPVRLEPPPHHRFGSDEDSLSSWKNLVLKAPKKDLKRLKEKEHHMLRFGGTINRQKERRLILVYYLADDTISIYEQPARNTGQIGGKFLQRQRVRKPTSRGCNPHEAPYYDPQDFFVGAEVLINGHTITLDQTDEHTLLFLEGRPKSFSLEEVNLVLRKIRAMVATRYTKCTDAFRALDRNHDGVISMNEFSQMCSDLNLNLCEPEILTLMKFFDANGDGVIDLNEFVTRMQPKDYEGELDAGQETVGAGELQEDIDPTYQKTHHGMSRTMEQERVFKLFRAKLQCQRSIFVDVFRLMSQRAPDSLIGKVEFISVVEHHLHLGVSKMDIELLANQFFRTPGTRLTIKDFTYLMDGGSDFERKYL